MEFRALGIINQSYGYMSGVGEKEEGLKDSVIINEMLKHTVFKNDLKMQIDKSKKEIEEELNDIYK